MRSTLKYLTAIALFILGISSTIEAYGSSPAGVNPKPNVDTSYVTQSGCTVEKFKVYSPVMQRHIKVVVVLPPAYQTDNQKKFPILYTLHGKSAPYNTWAEMTRLQNELKDKPFIYTCLDGDDHSFYIDSKLKVKTARRADPDTTKKKSLFTTFFFDEFIPAVDEMYRVEKTKRGLTGFSMGGFGALHYALVHPEMFCSVSGLSAVFLDTSSQSDVAGGYVREMFGPLKDNRADYEAVDHYKRISALKEKGKKLPPVFLACGTEDSLLGQNRKMKAHLESLGFVVEYVESPGQHNWAYWHPQAVEVAKFHWKYFQ